MGLEMLLKILLSAVLGGLIGIEQEISHRESGLKANVAMAIGTTLITVLALELSGDAHTTGIKLISSPILGHLISAIGLIGAGIIIRERFSINRVTAAFSIWISGSLGIIVGTGYYLIAFASSIFIFLLFLLVKYFITLLDKQGKIHMYIISVEHRVSVISDIKKVLLELGISYTEANIRKVEKGFDIEILLSTSQTKNKAFLDRIMHIPDVKEISSESL